MPNDVLPDSESAELDREDFELVADQINRRSELSCLRALRLIRSRLVGRRVLFYPAAGALSLHPTLDLEPLRRFTHLCDAFVLGVESIDSPLALDHAEIVNALHPCLMGLEVVNSEPSLTPEELGEGLRDLWNSSAHRARKESTIPEGVASWHLAVERRIAHVTRNVDLFLIKMPPGLDAIRSATTVYNRLFRHTATAPRILCLKANSLQLAHDFLDWNGDLARVIRNGRVHPEIVITDAAPDVHDFPWNMPWQLHPGWGDSTSFRRANHLLAQPPGEGECEVQGILGGEGTLDAFRLGWDTRTERRRHRTVIISTPERTSESSTSVIACTAETPCLLQALEKAEHHGKQKAIIEIRGFEDQGPALTAWKMSRDEPFTFTILANSPGQVESFGPFADTVDAPT
jgi:hypothetical protein